MFSLHGYVLGWPWITPVSAIVPQSATVPAHRLRRMEQSEMGIIYVKSDSLVLVAAKSRLFSKIR